MDIYLSLHLDFGFLQKSTFKATYKYTFTVVGIGQNPEGICF